MSKHLFVLDEEGEEAHSIFCWCKGETDSFEGQQLIPNLTYFWKEE